MQQLPLAISPPPAPTFGNFIEGANAEVLLSIRELAAGALRETIVYLWGRRAADAATCCAPRRPRRRPGASW